MKKSVKIAIIVLSLLVVSISALFIYMRSIMDTNTIYDNIFVNDVEVSNMTKDQAKTALSSKFSYGNLTLTKDDLEFTQDLSELGFSYEIDDAVEQAYEVGRKNKFFGDVFTVLGLKLGKNEVIELKSTENLAKLDEFFSTVATSVNRPAKDADVYIQNGLVNISESETGYKLDDVKLKQDVENAIKKAENKSEISVVIPVVETQPNIKTENLSQINGRIASYSSRYKVSDVERSYNVHLAAEKVDNQLLMPGQEISFMNTLGNVSQDNGFKMAKIIVNNEYQDGVGGGVCQVSSTLYNALLKSGVGITQRTNHTFPIGYIPTGLDATVANGGPDLKYKNNYDFPIFIKNYAYNGYMVSEVYGNVEKAKTYEVMAEITSSTPPNVIYKNDNTIEKGKEVVDDPGHTGYTSVAYKIVNGERVVISRDTYAMTPKIIKVGTKEVEPTTPDPNANPAQASQAVHTETPTTNTAPPTDDNVVF